MTTRPGYVWDNTALEWVNIGPVALPGSNVFYQSSAPSSPATGDIWVDADDEVPGITSSLNYRWRRIATGGETSLSGNDSSGLPLAYNPGYEQVYLNGVLQYRGSDYVATTGNTITGLTALVANDTIEVLSFVTAPIGDTYTQVAADGKFANKVRYNSLKRTSGDFSFANTNWTQLSTAVDISIPAQAGDLVTWTMKFISQGTQGGATIYYQLDGGVMNNSSFVRYLYGALGGGNYGGWGPDGYPYSDGPKHVEINTVVQSADLFGGTFTVRPYIRQFGASSAVLVAGVNNPMVIEIVNHGQAA
jgi:hypothetical protein